ncbi:hypothetical protein PPE03_05210 [Pseudoalteromonas peptidolytica]|nr:hypothetical protein PPE03_05210 [Pseudoalteromonas peptidolytica]
MTCRIVKCSGLSNRRSATGIDALVTITNPTPISISMQYINGTSNKLSDWRGVKASLRFVILNKRVFLH